MSRQLARRRRRDQVAGSALALLGVAVLVVAVIALRHPKTAAAGALPPSTSAGAPTTAPVTTPRATTSSSGSAAGQAVPTPASTASPAASITASGAARVPLVVLNNTTIRGLAQQASARFAAGGWTVTSYGNYRNDILSTCAYYDPSVSGAQASAQALQAQFPTIKRVLAKFAQLPAGPIVVVLTTDYSPN